MTREDIIRMAREAGVYSGANEMVFSASLERFAALVAEQPKHPGYVIGSHWLETAYSRICAGEAEEEVLRDCGWRRCAVGQRLTQYCAEAEALRRDAERYRWMTENHPEHETRSRVYSVTLLFNAYQKEHIDAAIDAAMEDKT